MKPDERFLHQEPIFWANVKLISQLVGYAENKQVKVPAIQEIKAKLHAKRLSSTHLVDEKDQLTELGKQLFAYFQHRANVLNTFVRASLMKVDEVTQIFIQYYDNLYVPLKMNFEIVVNKQSGDKKAPALFTAIINMLIAEHANGLECDYAPQELTTIVQNNMPLRTFSRRVDGAFCRTMNPVAIWEVKEYYYTTSFGSRVADGIYESLLDGMEIEELRKHTTSDVQHYLMIDGYGTWWGASGETQQGEAGKTQTGKSYLCRIIDMLHMGYVDEVLFGREVIERLPVLVKEWVQQALLRGEISQQKINGPKIIKEAPTKVIQEKRWSRPKKPTRAELNRILVKEWVEKARGSGETSSQIDNMTKEFLEPEEEDNSGESDENDGGSTPVQLKWT